MDNEIKSTRGAKEAVWVIGSLMHFQAMGLLDGLRIQFNQAGFDAYREIDDNRHILDSTMICQIVDNLANFKIDVPGGEVPIAKVVLIAWKNEREEFLKRSFSELMKK